MGVACPGRRGEQPVWIDPRHETAGRLHDQAVADELDRDRLIQSPVPVGYCVGQCLPNGEFRNGADLPDREADTAYMHDPVRLGYSLLRLGHGFEK